MVDKHGVINTALKVSNYCHQVDMLKESYGTGGPKGAEEFDQILI